MQVQIGWLNPYFYNIGPKILDSTVQFKGPGSFSLEK